MSPAQSPPHLITRADVASLLEIPLRQLTWWVWALREDRRYDHFEIERRGGGDPRSIHAPIKPLKDIQRRLATALANSYRPPPQVHGFVGERSPVTNARTHRRQAWVLRVDLENFFPSINFGRVRGLFQAFPFEYPPEVSTLLAQICCHENQLPQGAPTSPIVSNFICRGMDKELARIAGSERCYYSRYADDLCFSTDRSTFPASLGYIEGGVSVPGSALEQVIRKHGFSINGKKTRLMRNTQRQRVTGLVVNEKINVSRAYIRSLRSLLFIWRQHGLSAAEEAFARSSPHRNWPPGKSMPDFKLLVRGRIQYVGSIKGWDSPVYARLSAALATVDSTFVPRPQLPVDPNSVRLFTEGETDVLHMLAAQRYFHDRGDFAEIELTADANSALDGDDKLLQHCRALSRAPQPDICLCLFDRDNDTILRTALGSSPWKNWGNGVLAVALLAPTWRDRGERLCIEMLYEDGVLRREDPSGRRLFLASEFDERSGHHHDGHSTTTNPRNRALVREDVFAIGSGESIGMTKTDFAEAVTSGTDPYSDLPFEGFRSTFENIVEAVRATRS